MEFHRKLLHPLPKKPKKPPKDNGNPIRRKKKHPDQRGVVRQKERHPNPSPTQSRPRRRKNTKRRTGPKLAKIPSAARLEEGKRQGKEGFHEKMQGKGGRSALFSKNNIKGRELEKPPTQTTTVREAGLVGNSQVK